MDTKEQVKPTQRHKDILEAYDIHDSDNISTEQLFQMVCDTIEGIDHADVAEALYLRHLKVLP